MLVSRFYVAIITRYVVCAGGHKQATKMIQTCTSRVKKLLAQYSDLQRQLNDDHSEVDINFRYQRRCNRNSGYLTWFFSFIYAYGSILQLM